MKRYEFTSVLGCVILGALVMGRLVSIAYAATAVSFSLPDAAGTVLTRAMGEENAVFAAMPAPQPTPYASLNAYVREKTVLLATDLKLRQETTDNAGNRPFAAQLKAFVTYCASLSPAQKTACGTPCSFCP